MSDATLAGTTAAGAPLSFDLPPAAAAQVTTSLAAILLGYTFACVLYGAGSVQAFVYFRVSPRDGPMLKTSVALIWMLDTLHTALLTAAMYTVVVKDWSDVFALARSTWTLSGSIFVTCVIEIFVRMLLVNRIYKLSRGNLLLTGSLIALSLVVFALSLYFGVCVQRLHDFTELRSSPGVIAAPFGAGLVADVATTGAQCILLWRTRTGFAASDSIVRTLVAYILNSGALICIVTAAILITYAALPSLLFIGLYIVLPKAFFNALLVSLNVRELVFARPGPRELLPGPAPHARGVLSSFGLGVRRPARSVASWSAPDVEVRVQTTTTHRVDGPAPALSIGGCAVDDKDVWIPMAAALHARADSGIDKPHAPELAIPRSHVVFGELDSAGAVDSPVSVDISETMADVAELERDVEGGTNGRDVIL